METRNCCAGMGVPEVATPERGVLRGVPALFGVAPLRGVLGVRGALHNNRPR
jgi:hypothetical protein